MCFLEFGDNLVHEFQVSLLWFLILFLNQLKSLFGFLNLHEILLLLAAPVLHLDVPDDLLEWLFFWFRIFNLLLHRLFAILVFAVLAVLLEALALNLRKELPGLMRTYFWSLWKSLWEKMCFCSPRTLWKSYILSWRTKEAKFLCRK